MITDFLWVNAGLLFLLMTFWFTVAKARDQLNVVDVAWGLGFILVAWSVYAQNQIPRTLLIATLVTLWGIRLMAHLSKRIFGKNAHEDPRYEVIKKKWKRAKWLRAYFMIFMLQGFLILLISLPITLAGGTDLPYLEWVIYTGAVIWFAGYTIERIADAQMREFKNNRKNMGNVLDTGLWHYSRHPNYFGEIVQWLGIALIACQASWGWVGFAGPLLLTLLILFVSGIPPIEKRKKSDPTYAEYMKRTSMLIPLPPKT